MGQPRRMQYKPPQDQTRVPSDLKNDLRAALPTSGNGRLVRDLQKRGFGTEVEINNALAKMLDSGEVRRNGKRWVAVETVLHLGNGKVIQIQPESPRQNTYPILREALEDLGYSRYQGRVIRKQRLQIINKILSRYDQD